MVLLAPESVVLRGCPLRPEEDWYWRRELGSRDKVRDCWGEA